MCRSVVEPKADGYSGGNNDDVMIGDGFSGTTVVMKHEGEVVYRIHLHPGRDHYWYEVLLRASSAVRTVV